MLSDFCIFCIVAFSPIPGQSTYLQPQNLNFHHNHIYDVPEAGYEAFSTVYAGGVRYDEDIVAEDYKNRFEYNWIDNADGDYENLSFKNGGWTVSYNLIENSEGFLTLRGSYNSTVSYNVLDNNLRTPRGG